MITSKYFKILFISLAFIALFSSCRKGKLNKIEGTWRQINVSNIVEDPTEILVNYWEFNNGNVTSFALINENRTDWGEASYDIKNRTLMITGEDGKMKGGDLFLGEYHIDKLSKDFMIVYRSDNGLVFHEFEKVE